MHENIPLDYKNLASIVRRADYQPGASRIAAMIFSSPPQFGQVFEVELKDALEQPSPAHARRPATSTARFAGSRLRCVGALGATDPAVVSFYQAEEPARSCSGSLLW
jgi:hypothetical protein